MNIKSIKRTKCVICHKEDLEILHTFEKFPIFMGSTDKNIEEDLFFDMCFVISKESGLVQLKELLPLDILYSESHSGSCIGELWARHHSYFAKFISQYCPKSVLEIGGAHGTLSKKYEVYGDIQWVIVEPNPLPAKGVNAKFIKAFFDDKFTFEDNYDCIVHSHVFEHIYEPDVFMDHISSFMKEGKKLFFSVPNMKAWIEKKYTNCINLEHTLLLTEPYIEFLLAKHSIRVIKKEYFLNDHSIFYSCIKDLSTQPKNLDVNLYKENKKLFLDYLDYYKKLIDGVNKKIKDDERNIYLFGAHIFTQYLLAFGLNAEKIKYILDNDTQKQEKRLYGTSLCVKSPKILKEVKEPVVILKAGVHNEEIKKDILENINANTTFWE